MKCPRCGLDYKVGETTLDHIACDETWVDPIYDDMTPEELEAFKKVREENQRRKVELAKG